jgi:hypothetical protein
VHLGIYEFRGDPEELIAGYHRLMAMMPSDATVWHLCARRDDGIVVYDTCPSEEIFRGFSTSPGFHEAIAAAGLPEPAVSDVPVVAARSAGGDAPR